MALAFGRTDLAIRRWRHRLLWWSGEAKNTFHKRQQL